MITRVRVLANRDRSDLVFFTEIDRSVQSGYLDRFGWCEARLNKSSISR